MNTVDNTTNIDKDDVAELVYEKLLEWLDSDATLPPEARESLIFRLKDIRLKIQAIVLEIHRRKIQNLAVDVDLEAVIRRDIRTHLPYLEPKDKVAALKALIDTNAESLAEIKEQIAGFDFPEVVQQHIENLSDTDVAKGVIKQVKALPEDRRQRIMDELKSMIKESESEPKLIEGMVVDGTAINE